MLILRIVNKGLVKKIPWRSLITGSKFEQQIQPINCCCRSGLVQLRYYSNPQCPPQQKSGGRGRTIMTLGALTLVAGGATLGYAKYDSEFRKTLKETVPFSDTLIKYMFQEDGAGVPNIYENLKTSVMGAISSGDSNRHGKKQDAIPEPKEYKAPPPIVPAIEKEVEIKSEKSEAFSEIRIAKKGTEEGSMEVTIAEGKPEAQEGGSEGLAELEQQICKSAEDAVNAYNKALHILRQYNQDIEYIVDEAVTQINPEVWEDVRRKTRSKTECIRRAQEKAEEAERNINRLKATISRPDFKASESTKEIITNNIIKVQQDIEDAKKELNEELKQGRVTEKYWDKVEKARQHFSEELEILFPSVDISKKKLQLSEEELDLFVLHAYAHVLFYQKELAKLETLLQNRIHNAVEAAKKGGLEPLSVAQICEAVEQEKRRMTLCFQQQILKLKKEYEEKMREQLKIQSQTFNDHLNDAIRIKELEIERLLSRKYDELMENERCKYKIQLAAMVGRLKGLDEAIKERNDADASSKQAQVLWSACQALLRSIKAGCPGIPWKDQIRPLEPEIAAVKKASAPNDELVQVVINSIPKEAVERGVYPEDALRERFLKVEKVARTVSLIPSEGAALPVHILSYIQSLLLIKAASPIPQAELNDEKVDFSNLNTNDILQRARYWLDRGDFAQALKYMNLLQGAPRCVARQWMNETRILLETQQAANTLMAHAASSGLMFL